MRITFTIDTGNAAFDDDNKGVEVSRIVRKALDRVGEDFSRNELPLHDYNGNKVGTLKITGK